MADPTIENPTDAIIRVTTTGLHVMTPGWCDTGLVRQGRPRFREFFRPILRNAAQGADTANWLAADDVEPDRLWRDRHPRWKYRLPWTVGGDSVVDLWASCRTERVPVSVGRRPALSLSGVRSRCWSRRSS